MKIVTTLLPAFLRLPSHPWARAGRPGWSNPGSEAAPGCWSRQDCPSLPALPGAGSGAGHSRPRSQLPQPRTQPCLLCLHHGTQPGKKEIIRRRKRKAKPNQTKPFPCNVQTYNSYPRWSIETSMLWEKQVNWKHKSARDSSETKNGKKNVHELSLPPKQIHFRNLLPFHDINTQETRN